MKRFIRTLLLLLILGFVTMQFFQPEKNSGEITENHLFSDKDIPEDIKLMIKTSCTDCHSNQTNYLWYHKIAPVSFLINQHIVKGKKELNISDWKKMDGEDKISALSDICQEVKSEKMPIKQYTMLHPAAKLSKEQIDRICAWSEKYSEDILTQLSANDSVVVK